MHIALICSAQPWSAKVPAAAHWADILDSSRARRNTERDVEVAWLGYETPNRAVTWCLSASGGAITERLFRLVQSGYISPAALRLPLLTANRGGGLVRTFNPGISRMQSPIPASGALSVLYGRQNPAGRDGFEQLLVVLFVLVSVSDGKVRDGVVKVLVAAQVAGDHGGPRGPGVRAS